MGLVCWIIFTVIFVTAPKDIEQSSLEPFLKYFVWIKAYRVSADKRGQVYFNNLQRGRYLCTPLTHSQSLCILAKQDPFLRKENYFHP